MLKRIMNKIFAITILLVITITSVYAITPTNPAGGSIPSAITTSVPNIWGSVAFVVQIISIGCVVFAGLRYMFASPSGKAEIKKTMLYLIIGSILIFGATTVIKSVVTII